MNRLLNMPMCRLTDSEKKWLENRVHDSRPEVVDLARSVYNMCFPHAERNAMKKQLHINVLTFGIHGKVYDGYDDYEMVNRCFTVDRKACALVYADLVHNEQEPFDNEESLPDSSLPNTSLVENVVPSRWSLLSHGRTTSH